MNTNDSRIVKIKQISDMISVWVGVLALISGGIWGIVQYLEQKADQRVAETLAYIDRFNDNPVYEARKRIEAIWREVEADAKEASGSHDEQKWTEFVLNLVSTYQIDSEISTMIEFFESIAVCEKEKICDDKTAHSFFGAQALLFKNQHIRYIKWLREDLHDPSIGEGLQRFSNCYRRTVQPPTSPD